MTLTNEDLLALSQMMDTKLQPLEKRLIRMDDRLTRVEAKVDQLEAKVDQLESDVKEMRVEVERMKKNLTQVMIRQESVIIPRLSNIEKCYLDTYSRYQEAADKVDAVCEDVDLLKKVVSDHSEKLRNIKMM